MNIDITTSVNLQEEYNKTEIAKILNLLELLHFYSAFTTIC